MFVPDHREKPPIYWLQDWDMILLATRDMVAGEELLLTYKDDSSSTSADRVGMFLQYGVPANVN
eukprot:scaffold133245_cov50-Attheya_sp.AAC.4